jgi:hypothetical protein
MYYYSNITIPLWVISIPKSCDNRFTPIIIFTRRHSREDYGFWFLAKRGSLYVYFKEDTGNFRFIVQSIMKNSNTEPSDIKWLKVDIVL